MSALKYLLLLLLAFLRPGVEGDTPPADDSADDPPGDDPPADDPPADDPPADDPPPDQSAQLRADNERLARELTEARAARDAKPDPTFEEEERKLKDPATDEQTRYWINANRTIRATNANSAAALAEARDVSDRTKFQQLAVSNPALFKKYESRVEEHFQRLKATGSPAPREAILRFMLGDDQLKGALVTKKAPAKLNEAVNRGKLPGARSDLNGKNSLSEREKRRARLENQQI